MIVESEFSPSWWLSNPHLQTIVASKLFRPVKTVTRRERIELDDGDFIDINSSTRSSGDIVALFHGLAGCVESSYIQGAISTLEAAGFRPVLMHWRGCSGEPNRLPKAYHSGASEDIAWFINYLRKRFSNQAIYAVGYSLGANALLKFLGESGSDCALSGAVSVCPPLVLSEGAKKLDSGFSRHYQRYLLRLMCVQHERKRMAYPQLQLPVAGKHLNSLWKFDDAITAPLHGFEGVHDFYNKCSARQFLPLINIPTHILCARDDPFFTPDVLPDEAELAQKTTFESSPAGGHVGFLSAEKNNRRWLDTRVSSLVSKLRDAV